jgi:Protein of unknown function (DUF2897)
MLKAILIIAVVVAALIGGILTLRSSARTGMPSEDVLRRATQRARELEAQEKKDD